MESDLPHSDPARDHANRDGVRETRVLHVTQVIARYRIPLYGKLARLPGWNLLVLHGTHTSEAGTAIADSTAQLPFRAAHVRNQDWHAGSLTLRWQRGALARARAFRPDVVIVSGEAGIISSWIICSWARLTGRGVITWTSAWEPQRPGSLSLWIKRMAMRLYLRVPNRTLTYSTRAKTALMALGMSEERIAVCHNGLDVSEPLSREGAIRSAAGALRNAEQTGDRLVFLYVGRMAPEKSVDLLLTAFGRSPAHRASVLWLVGDGPESTALQNQAATLGLENIKFWGRVMDNVDKYFASADCFVLPGLGGLALNQAMVFGVPCICSVADGTEDDLVIDGATGLRFAPGDPTSLSATLERAVEFSASGHLARMGDAAQELLLRQSSVDHMVETFRVAVHAVDP